jgi:proteic killer suppression protein
MIVSFGNQLAADLYDDKKSKATRQFPAELLRVTRRKLLYLHDADQLTDLRVPPGNRLEALKGDLRSFHAIRINDQWRIIFQWKDGNAFEVQVVDYHR